MKKYSKQISLGYDATGKRIRKRIYADSPSELKALENAEQRKAGKNGLPNSVTFKQYAERWYDINISILSPNTQAYMRTVLNKCEDINYVKMQSITRSDLKAIMKDNWNHPYEARRIAITLSAIFRDAVIDGIITNNIADGLKRPPVIVKEKHAFTPEELDAIRSADFTPQEQLMVNVLLQFGLRPGEALALNRHDIQSHTLTVSKSLAWNGNAPFIKHTKTNKVRVLPVPESVLPKLKPIDNHEYLFTKDGNLFTKKQMYEFSRHIINKINKAYGEKIPDLTLYKFRHHKASLLYYTEGVSLKVKAAYMGHSEEMFIKTYSHLMEEREDMKALNEAVI